jgi:DNA-binding phage protein
MKVSLLQEERGLTSYRIAKDAGVQIKQLNAIKAGDNYDIDTLLKVLRVLNAQLTIQ